MSAARAGEKATVAPGAARMSSGDAWPQLGEAPPRFGDEVGDHLR